MRMRHTCHARNCERPITPAKLMCRRHWLMVTRKLQLEVLRTYQQGQENPRSDVQPSMAWVHAAGAAIDYVAGIEQAEAASKDPINRRDP